MPHSARAVPGKHAVKPPTVPQQPLGHVAGLHSQLPPSQTVPAAHSPKRPQLHPPIAEHVSLVCGLHVVQLPPARPHVGKATVSHVEPTQQPVHVVGQVPHVPALHCCPAEHAAQVLPPVPQLAA